MAVREKPVEPFNLLPLCSEVAEFSVLYTKRRKKEKKEEKEKKNERETGRKRGGGEREREREKYAFLSPVTTADPRSLIVPKLTVSLFSPKLTAWLPRTHSSSLDQQRLAAGAGTTAGGRKREQERE